ncbi:pentatricopeptide repeat-containing protein At4g02750-like [Aristolochia californica]|uniref:pentatricopeptide repeat-containing protein At4g02750-like n=1 Tax=Aristolochia californica TaxID=171875 RepID=UPI0035DC3F1E
MAHYLFDKMPERNEVSWSSIISGYARNGDLDVAQALFDKMPVKRNTVTWNSMISGFARSNLLPLAQKLFDEMPERSIVSWNSMISGYAQNGQLESARELFDQMPEKDVFTWSSMISGYAQNNHCREALDLFKEMQSENKVRPNEVTMLSIISVCAQLAALEQGKWVHAFIDKIGMPLNDNLGAALVDMYMKCGCMETASKLFWKLDQRDVSTWNAFITGLAVNGASHESLEAFNEMQRLEIKPNDITFMGVLMACSHGGLLQEGQKHFENMSKIYGIQPETKHYGCMIDMLGRAGLLEEAEEIVRKMPMKPDVMILGALLGACKIHGNVHIARRVGQDFLKLQNTEASCHLLLSNIYAAGGRWEEASEIRSRIKRSGFKKEPGSSC